jgi:diadenosine tetraphosphate (Ap4A) HIT family hydrolase
MAEGCFFCEQEGGEVLFRNDLLRVVWIDEPDYPGFCRVVANTHVAEILDLSEDDQRLFMQFVFAIAHAQRVFLRPDKINLASLGNQVPHLHWHVIPRWKTDANFPNSVWSPKEREGDVPATPEQVDQLRLNLLEQLPMIK